MWVWSSSKVLCTAVCIPYHTRLDYSCTRCPILAVGSFARPTTQCSSPRRFFTPYSMGA